MLKRTRAVGTLVAAAVALATLPVPALAETAVEDLVAKKAAILDRMHEKAEKALVTAAQDQAFAAYFRAPSEAERARLKERLDAISLQVQRRFRCEEMCLINPQGVEISRIVGKQVAHDLSHEEAAAVFFAPAFEQAPRTVYISPVYMSPDADKWVLAYVTPIVVDGEEAILHYEHTLRAYQEALAKDLGGEDPFIVAVDADGWVVADSRREIAIEKRGELEDPGDYFERFEWHGRTLEELKRELGGGGDRGSGLISVDGMPYSVAYQPAGRWTLVGIARE